MTVLVGCFAYLKQAGRLAHNPAMEIKYAAVPARLPKAVLSHPEMKKLLRQPDMSTVLGFRDRTIMALRAGPMADLTNAHVRPCQRAGGVTVHEQSVLKHWRKRIAGNPRNWY